MGRRHRLADRSPGPDRVITLTALSVGHAAALRSAGWRQRELSSYMLLFHLPASPGSGQAATTCANGRRRLIDAAE
jgi:hypothetical protein